MLELKVTQFDAAVAVRADGSIDALTAAQVDAALKAQFEAGRNSLVLDLGGVDFTSSAGLRVILAATKEARNKGGDLRLAAIRPSVLRVFELSGFLGVIKTYADADAAAASFRA